MVGVDVVEIERVIKVCEKEAFINKLLTIEEKEYLETKSKVCKNKHSEYHCSLAGFWAAKEAVLKALQIGMVADLKQIQILHKQNGAPYVKFNKEFCKMYNIDESSDIEISVSHDAGVAICVCISH